MCGQGSGYSISGEEPAYIDCGPSKTDLNFPYTIEAWVKLDAIPTLGYAIWDSGLEPSGLYYGSWFLITSVGEVALVYGDGTGLGSADRRSIFSTVSIPLGEWVHICGVQDGPLVGRIYINGIEVPVTYAGTGGMTIVHYPAGRQTIGWHESLIPGIYLDGELDELRVWGVGRTEAEIRETMCQKLSGTEPGLEAYWRFDEGMGTTVADLSGSGHNGTFVGAMNWQLSGAPLGDTSIYTYPASWLGETLTIEGPGSEQFTVSDVAAVAVRGLHIYRVDEFPNDLSGLPTGTSDHYYGVFSTTFASTYTINASLIDTACTACTIDWVTRNDNAAGPWLTLPGIPSPSGCIRSKSGESSIGDSWRAEYAWADSSVFVAAFSGDTTFNSICEGDSVQVEGNWLSAAGIYPFLNPGISGCDSLTWYALDIETCQDTIPEEPLDTCILALPNAFSPNADGINDEFGIPQAIVCNDLTFFNLVIYNRWGQLIWATSSPDVKWNGTFKGKDQELGVYVWLLQYQRAQQPSFEKQSGTVTLIK